MIPEGWERRPIKDLCESIIDCVNKTAKHVDFETPYRMIRTTNVRHGRVDTSSVRYVDEETYKQWIRRGAPKDGDIIFTREAPVGEAGILEDSEGIFLGQRTMMYRAHPEKSDNRFLLYSLLSGHCQKQIEDFSNGGTVAHMRVPDCGEIFIYSPPLPEQRKIAKILQTWDRAIATTEKLIDASKQQKKALMQQLLTGKKRFAEFEGEWEATPLGKTGKIVAGGTPSTTTLEYWNGDVLWLTPTDVTKLIDRYVLNTARKITTLGVKNSSATLLPKGSLMVCTRATVGQLAISTSEICTNQGFKSIIPNRQFCVEFVYHSLSKNRRELINRACGSTFLELSKKDFEKVEILCPEIEEQRKIADVLAIIDQTILALKNKTAHLKQEKKALMQQLLTGKRRVKVDD